MTIETLKEILSKGEEHLGDLAWWSLNDAKIDRFHLESIWSNANLPESLLPENTTPERSLRAAIKETQAGLGDRLIRLGKESDTELIYAIVKEYRENDGSVSFTQECRIILDRVNAAIWSDNHNHEIYLQIRERYNALLNTHTTCEIRRCVLRTLKSFSAVSLRDHGGIYWVPRNSREELRRLQEAIENIGTSRFHVLPVHDSQEAQMEITEIAQGSLEAELTSLRKELEEFAACPPERISTLAKRFDTYDALRQRAQLYSSILRLEIGELDQAVDSLNTELQKILENQAMEQSAA